MSSYLQKHGFTRMALRTNPIRDSAVGDIDHRRRIFAKAVVLGVFDDCGYLRPRRRVRHLRQLAPQRILIAKEFADKGLVDDGAGWAGIIVTWLKIGSAHKFDPQRLEIAGRDK